MKRRYASWSSAGFARPRPSPGRLHASACTQVVLLRDACQAEFVAAAAARRRRCRSADAELPVTVVGDFNIDTKWGKIDATAQAEALASVRSAAARAALKREGLETFCATLSAAGALFEPPLATLTTLKQRTRFQGQPHKAGELTVAHKDFVILPSPAKLRVRDVVLGGMPDPAARGANAVMAHKRAQTAGDRAPPVLWQQGDAENPGTPT